MSPPESRRRRFFSDSVSFVCSQLGADWGCFYRIDRQGNASDFAPLGVPYAVREGYLAQGMRLIDPLHPVRVGPTGLRLATLNDRRLRSSEDARQRLHAFNRSFGMHAVAQLIFRDEQGVVGAMSVAWVRGASGRLDVERGLQVHSYVQSALNLILESQPAAPAPVADDRLSQREQEIVDLACRGLTNQQIASALHIGVATVKTHLINIFVKLGIRNRAMLVRRTLGFSAGS